MVGEQYEGEGSSMRVVCNAQVENLKHISDMIEAVDQRQLAAGVKGQKNNTSHRTTYVELEVTGKTVHEHCAGKQWKDG